MLLLLSVASAWAYSTSGYAWPPDRLPVEVHWTGELPGFSDADLRGAVEGAVSAWAEAAPCVLEVSVVEDPDAHAWFLSGGVAILFGDPDDELSAELLAVTYWGSASGDTFWSNGRELAEMPVMEVVVNDVNGWLPDWMIVVGECEDEVSLQGLLTHQMGSALGLATYGEEEAVSGAVPTMYWSQSVCDTGASSLEDDDIAGLWAIYGGSYGYTFGCENDAADLLTVDCAIANPSLPQGDSPTWDFGDGATAEGDAVSHTYTEEDSYWIDVCVQWPTCGDGLCDSIQVRAGEPIPASEPWSAWSGESEGECEGCGTTPGAPVAALLGAVWALAVRRRFPGLPYPR